MKEFSTAFSKQSFNNNYLGISCMKFKKIFIVLAATLSLTACLTESDFKNDLKNTPGFEDCITAKVS